MQSACGSMRSACECMRTHADDADHANINTNTNTNTNTKMNANTNTNRNEIVSGKKESAKGQRGTPRGGGERARYPAGAEERVRKADGPDIGTIRTVEETDPVPMRGERVIGYNDPVRDGDVSGRSPAEGADTGSPYGGTLRNGFAGVGKTAPGRAERKGLWNTGFRF